jgi:hypothetical protein
VNRGRGQRYRMWLLPVAIVAVGVAVGAVIAAGEQRSTGTGAEPAAARPPQGSPFPTTAPSVAHRFYVLVRRLPGNSDDARTAKSLAAQARAKGFPATVIHSHGDLPPNTGQPWIAVLSGKFPNRQEAEAQANRLRQAGFPDAEILDVACDDLAGKPIPVQAC